MKIQIHQSLITIIIKETNIGLKADLRNIIQWEKINQMNGLMNQIQIKMVKDRI